ncbi:MAG: apolipoprotein N-acyltransferase [Candidatus Melainabacteria bacterium]|nr:apolipoprotein N-acyltransferase [Candidatus Melainabacteria bacterium]
MLRNLNLLISFSLNSPLSRLIFAITTGLVLGLSSAAFGLGFLAWIGLIPLFLLVKSADGVWRSCYEAMIFLLSYNLLTLAWLQALHPLTWHGFTNLQSIVIALAAWLVAALYHSFLTLPFVLALRFFYQYRADQRSHELKFLDMLILSFVWLVCQHKLLMHFSTLAVPINFLAYSQYQNHYLIQFASQVGAVGIEALILLVNFALSNIFNVQMNEQGLAYHLRVEASSLNVNRPFLGINAPVNQLNIFSILALVLIGVYGFGFWQLDSNKKYELTHLSEKQNFAIVQADYSAASSRGAAASAANLVKLQNQLSSKLVDRKDLLIWSEGSVPSDRKPESLNNLLQHADNFVFGTYTNISLDYFNSIQLRTFTDDDQVYLKRNLVPFGEYTPWYGLLPESLQKLANSIVGHGFAHGDNEQDLLETTKLKIAPALCFELLFPQLLRETVLKGADLIINLNDLSWFKGNKITRDWVKRQFLAVAVFRAVENRRDLILAGNAGYSALVNASGKVKFRSEANKIFLVQGDFLPRGDFSNFSLYGW